ncbi:hypothetical protein E3E22_07085 [Thermococcus sp. MV5]|uniref:hypothetical protein n=1 Tax=Thermococcus sp. MV5 TaxID=1638272 RepID=UPI0014387A39|nr:hypothetical protein [Thermococcus sp. MV5]NJE26384.1 hypothetical protein [Thermococcus sp. MV5]
MIMVIPLFVILAGVAISINYWQLGKKDAVLNLIIALVLSLLYGIVGYVLEHFTLLGTSAMFMGALLVLDKRIFLEDAQKFEIKIGKIRILGKRAVSIMEFMGIITILGALCLIGFGG